MRCASIFLLLASVVFAQVEAQPQVPDFKAIDWPGAVLDLKGVSVVQPAAAPELLLGVYPPAAANKAVVDGDTLRVEGQAQSLRLVGLDTEETFKDKGELALAQRDWPEYLKTVTAGTDPARPPKYASPMGEAARSFAQHFFTGVTQLRVELDHKERGIDYYGRNLTHVLVQKEAVWVNFNIEVVRQGLSPYFNKYGRTMRHHEAFVVAQKEAREAKRGIWATPPLQHAYADYPQRLKWWDERDTALQLAMAMEAATPAVVLLGLEREWTQACAAEGQQVTIVGGVGTVRHAGKGLGLLPIAHRNRQDFLIVGPIDKLKAHALAAEYGNILMLTGTVRLYEGRPQFLLEEGVALKRFANN